MYDGAALVEATHHGDPANTAHEAGKFQGAATEPPGHAAASTPAAPSMPAPTPTQITHTLRGEQDMASTRVSSDGARASMALGSPTVGTTGNGITVAEPSSLNAAGAARGTLTGWSIVDDGTGGAHVTVTAIVAGPTKGSLVSGTPATAIAGGYRFSGTVAEANAWLNQLSFVAADVELGNTAARTTIEVTVTDAQSLSATHSLDVTVTPSNDPVAVPDATKTVQEVDGTSDHSVTVLGTDTLNASDAEVTAGTQTPGQIVYSLTALPQYGYLALDGNRLGAGSVFTQ